MTDPDAKSLHLRPTPGLRPMRPRDPHEQGRVASSLELLFDLIFVVAFATSGAQFAQLVAVGGVASIEGIVGFTVCTFGIVWAWINFAWFASAFDTDDWFYRLCSFCAMAGAVIFAIGIPRLFASLHEDRLDMKVIVAGYVVMRLVLAVQWLRAGARNPEFRRTGIGYATVFGTAQVAWIVMALANLPLLAALVVTGIIALYELLGIFFVERYCRSTSWHPHHIAERYGLLVIITLGEGVVGTVAAVSALVGIAGWSLEAGLLALTCVVVVGGMWWLYFSLDFGAALHEDRSRGFRFGYGHFIIYAALAAVGAGLHTVGALLAGESQIGTATTVGFVAGPLALYLIAVLLLHGSLVGSLAPTVLLGLLGALALIAGGLLAAWAGVAPVWCLLPLALAPYVAALGTERAARRQAG